MSIALMVVPDASVSTVKGSLKLGRANTSALVMAVLSLSKAFCDSCDHSNASLHSRWVSGVAIAAYC